VVAVAIAELRPSQTGGYRPRGAARALWKCRDHEVMLAGPAETGKTYACCQKLDALLWKYPGSQAVMVRKTLASLHTTVLKTYRNVLGPETPVAFYGGEKPQWADYPNGSRLYFAGLDKASKALSSERDFVYVNQAEELSLGDWETLTTRCTGRAANAPYSQILADCNPGPPSHWIKHRPSLRIFESRHEDNPTLYTEDGRLTDRGERTMAVLDALTGVRYLRLRKGLWAGAEGMVYEEWDPAIHCVDPFEIPADWRRIRSIDFGFTNPFVCQWWAIDPDGRLYLYRELYGTNRLVSDWGSEIRHIERWDDPERREPIEATVADWDAEGRATLEDAGILTTPAHKKVKEGIEAVQLRLRRAGDGRPRLFVFRDCRVEADPRLSEAGKPTCTAEEFEGYVWAPAAENRPAKEEPLKVNDHGLDALRYAVAYADHLGTVWIEAA
jgi:PBSX family phage terminase large subunit